MKRAALVAVVSMFLGHVLGFAQGRSPFQAFADYRNVVCVSWVPATAFRQGETKDQWLYQAPSRAWVYGFLAGAGYMPRRQQGERTMQADIRNVDAMMDAFCARHKNATIEDALQSLMKDLDSLR